MFLRKLSYQHRVMESLDAYLDELVRLRPKAEKIKGFNSKEPDPDLHVPELNFPKTAWDNLKNILPRPQIGFSPRVDGMGRPVPNIVYKIPTGGGKTFMAASSLAPILTKHLDRQNGFVLWIVPNEAIYSQTLKQLTDKEHPYRQLLNNLAGASKDVKIMDKTMPFSAQEVQEKLCLMLLMLQSTNRQNKNTLKVFRERGDVHGFIPPENNRQAHKELKEAIPNLDVYNLADSPSHWQPVKESLGNALRIIRPVVILDEGHKAVSDLAFETLYGFNPSFVLELTATPKDKPRTQNILVQVSGAELDREGMLKMPINVDSQQKSKDWKDTLKIAMDRLDALAGKAKKHHANRGRYIRPIMLVQVERTGADQRDGKHIHAEDVREWLLTNRGMQDYEIAIKTSQQNDLKNPENQNLLAPENQVRVIITKQALQEGWDCPFAYVLCTLSASQTTTAMTQIMGRILRQPYAEKTGVAELDQCYIITHHAKTGEVVQAIKGGLEREGMQDLQGDIHASSGGGGGNRRTIPRRKGFAGLSIFMPKVIRHTPEELRELDYETDILFPLDWRKLDVSAFVKSIPDNYAAAERQLYKVAVDLSVEQQEVEKFLERRHFDAVRIVRHICDIVQNPWVAYEIVDAVRQGLKRRKFSDEKLGNFSSFIESELRKWLVDQCTQKAEARFREEVEAGRIQFRLRTDSLNWKMPKTVDTTHPERTQHLMHYDKPVTKSLFAETYEPDFNGEEKNIALFLDRAETIRWWHRNAARHHYHIQGWKREKIYPDFICSVRKKADNEKLVALETKGDFLSGNEDSEYKRRVLQLMKDSFSLEKNITPVGKMEVLIKGDTCVECEMVLMKDYERRLTEILKP